MQVLAQSWGQQSLRQGPRRRAALPVGKLWLGSYSHGPSHLCIAVRVCREDLPGVVAGAKLVGLRCHMGGPIAALMIGRTWQVPALCPSSELPAGVHCEVTISGLLIHSIFPARCPAALAKEPLCVS
ncbi:hypothetical protein GCM10025331_29340 [Actinoplanes utahensis]|nr:hypothetical protein Aut01nite_41140 [Actinoplanes utahensis]